ncbi:unnamed protein product [Paramecium sonneborni]|uniref:TRAF-type domain-containing protein n=1 Tax=Paramecium sonneborni TaxID=65129 RepID=A0A8S1KX93_9CILI|nr:unnamed protein product [Paramecium sonneborni]
MHELYCVNNIKKCSICEQSFDNNDEEDHQNYHLQHTCSKCEIFQKDLNNHQCFKCQYCSKYFQKGEVQNHQELCKLKETRCSFCEKMIQNKQLELHLPYCKEQKEKSQQSQKNSKNNQKIFENEERLCPYCDLDLMYDYEDEDEHLKICGSRTEICSFCNQRILIMNKQMHELNCFQSQFNYVQTKIEELNLQQVVIQQIQPTDEQLKEYLDQNDSDD